MVVVVANEKGGTGKTTIATNLAILRAQQGADVLLVDADPQGSASEFVRVREDEQVCPTITSVAVSGRGVSSEVRKLIPKYQDIVIDAGGRDSAGLRSALVVADVLIVPFLAGQYDVWAVEAMDMVVGEALGLNSEMKPFLLMNKQDTNPRIVLGNEAAEIANGLQNLKLLEIRIGYRVAYRRSAAEGRAVNELDKKDAKAISEMDILYQEVFA